MENLLGEKQLHTLRMLRIKELFVGARCLVLQVLDPEGDYETEAYDLYVNGSRCMTADHTVVSLYDLRPDTDYGIQLERGGCRSEVLKLRTEKEYVTLNVRDFGARGDGVTDDTLSLQAAILTCPKGGRVYVPEGVFRFTNLFLKSDLVLELGKGAVLRAIPDKSRLPVLPGRVESYDGEQEFLPSLWKGEPADAFASLLTGMYVENVVICGQGTLDGCADFDNWWNVEKRKGDPARPRMIYLNHCSNVTVEGITLMNSPAWNIHPCFSERLLFANLTIVSPGLSHNTDGVNPESCTDVEMAGIHFSVGDDCVAIKSGKLYLGRTYHTPSRNILIHHCRMEKGHGGVTIGSEAAGGVDNVQIRNCHFVGTDRGLRIKTRRGRGRDSYLTGIIFDQVKMDDVKTAFVINCFYFCDPDGKSEYVSSKQALPVDERTPRVGVVTIRNVVCRNCHMAGIYFYGLPESKIEGVILENVKIGFARDAAEGQAAMMVGCETGSKKGIFIRNACRVSLKDVELSGCQGEPADVEDVDEWEWI